MAEHAVFVLDDLALGAEDLGHEALHQGVGGLPLGLVAAQGGGQEQARPALAGGGQGGEAGGGARGGGQHGDFSGGGLTGQVGPTPVGELGVTQELHQRGEVHLHRVTTARRR